MSDVTHLIFPFAGSKVLALSFREKHDVLDPLLRGMGVSAALAEGLPGEDLSNRGLLGYP